MPGRALRENTHNESAWEGMALVYSLIAKGMVVLAEYQTPGYENVKAFADEVKGLRDIPVVDAVIGSDRDRDEPLKFERPRGGAWVCAA